MGQQGGHKPTTAHRAKHPPTQNPAQNPVLVHVTRGGIIESMHRGRYVIVDGAGNVCDAMGDYDTPIYPRSSTKIFQALPMILCGAHKEYGLNHTHIAITCASHRGEPAHIQAVTEMLHKAGLSPADLECGVHPPTHRASADAITRAGHTFRAVHNNCSGKHAGMVVYAKKMGWDIQGYIHPDHPVQQSIRQHLGNMSGYDMHTAAVDRDGCSVPTWAVPLKNLAYAFARVANPDATLSPDIGTGIKTLTDAVAKHPFMIAGTRQCCTDVMQVFGKKVFVKGGAEGVYLASIPDYDMGIAIKVDDGSMRACKVILLRILEKVGVLSDTHKKQLMHHYAPPITNWNGYTVGAITPAF